MSSNASERVRPRRSRTKRARVAMLLPGVMLAFVGAASSIPGALGRSVPVLSTTTQLPHKRSRSEGSQGSGEMLRGWGRQQWGGLRQQLKQRTSKEEVEVLLPPAPPASKKGKRVEGAQTHVSFFDSMIAGAVSRSVAQTVMQPLNVVKTLLQGKDTAQQLSSLTSRTIFKTLTRGAGAQFILSLPHGAFSFATVEAVKDLTSKYVPCEGKAGFLVDFFSSAVATTICSVVSTPQMVITDRIMAGVYPNLFTGVRTIAREQGVAGFYRGWSASLVQKIPSYSLTWVFFQQFKELHFRKTGRKATDTENFLLGAAGAGATVCLMIPLDTVKTRIVTQVADEAGNLAYKGVVDCIRKVAKEEGVKAFYRSLLPRLCSVVPMMGIQFGIYEASKKRLIGLRARQEADREHKASVGALSGQGLLSREGASSSPVLLPRKGALPAPASSTSKGKGKGEKRKRMTKSEQLMLEEERERLLLLREDRQTPTAVADLITFITQYQQKQGAGRGAPAR